MRLPLGTGRPEKGFFLADRSYRRRGSGVATRYYRDCMGFDEFVAWREDRVGITHTHPGSNSNSNTDPDTNSDSNTDAGSNSNTDPDGDPDSIA